MSSAPVERTVVRWALTPREWQRRAMRRMRRFSVLVVHRRAGKTVLALLLLIDRAMKSQRRDGRFVYLSPLLRQSKDVAWSMLRQFTADIPGVEVKEGELAVLLPNGSLIRLYGADNPDSLRGLAIDFAVCDEVAQFRPEVWGEIIRPALADRKGGCLFIGTPKGVNSFSELYTRALGDVSGEWSGMMFRPEDTLALDEDELERLRAELTDAQYRQEILCDFGAATADSVIPLDLAHAAAGASLPREAYLFAPVVMGVDVARYGDGRTVIMRRQGRAAFAPLVLRSLSTVEVASQVARQIVEHQPVAVFIDSGGVGGGVVDLLLASGHRVQGVDFGSKASVPRFANRRAQMWWDLREWLEGGGVIPRDDALIADLCSPTYHFGVGDGRLVLESKDQLRDRGLPSPDLGDALALTFADPIPPHITKEAELHPYLKRQPFAQMAYDPWR